MRVERSVFSTLNSHESSESRLRWLQGTRSSGYTHCGREQLEDGGRREKHHAVLRLEHQLGQLRLARHPHLVSQLVAQRSTERQPRNPRVPASHRRQRHLSLSRSCLG